MNDVSAMRRVRIKDVLVEVGPRSKTGKGLPLSMTQDRGLMPTSEANVANPPSTYIGAKKVIPGDLVFNKLKAHLGVFAVSDYSGLVSPDYAVYRLRRDGVDIRYLNYLFHTPEYIDEFILRRSGVADGLKRLYTRELFQVSIPLPPKSLQSSIVNFLDAKCAEIDKAIEAAEASIEEYKLYKKSVIFQAVTKGLDPDAPMKDSGIEWIGEMPASWRSCRGKDVLNHLSRKTEEGDGIVTCFRDGEVTLRSNRREEGFTVAEKEFGYQGIEPGDLVVHGMDGFAGSIGVSDSRGKGSPVLNVLDSDENKRFLMYYLRGLAYRDVYMAMSTGIRVRSCNLNWKKLSELSFEIPERTEQDKIAAFLDMKCAEIDRAIEAKQIIIEELKSYKKSLIWETVTGKREVSCL